MEANKIDEIQIDITITMGETCSNTMSLAEAKALYASLDGLFGKKQENFLNTAPGVRSAQPDAFEKQRVTTNKAESTGEILHRNAKKLAEDALKENVTPGSEKPKMPPPNLKVEAARERAAARTRGCGQR